MITVTLLGTSALLPLPERALTAVFLACEGHSVLFDCGEGTQSAARKAGVSLMKTDLIALTHYHGDHVFGLPGLLQTMNSMGRTLPLYITGPEDLQERMAPILELTERTGYEIRLVTLPPEGLQLCSLMPGWPDAAYLTPFPTEHRIPSQGYRFMLDRAGKFLPLRAKELDIPVSLWSILQKGTPIQINGREILPEEVTGPPRKGLKVVFSGDTAPCSSLTEQAKDADLLICEGTYGDNAQAELAEMYGHMTFARAAETAAAAEVGELWLAHYSQMIEEPETYLPNALEFFPRTVCGKDGLTKQLRFESDSL